MSLRLTDGQIENRDRAREFAADRIAPWADEIDQRQTPPENVLTAMRGYLGAALPEQWGGGGLDPVSYGLVTEEIGKACSSVRSLMTVHNMSAQVIARIGNQDQREDLLPRLCTGERVIAFALSEPNVGSSTHALETQAVEHGDGYLLNGAKKWITFGQIADFFLVFAHCDQRPIALVVDRHSDGLSVTPVRDLLGTRGSMLAELRFDDVAVPSSRQARPDRHGGELRGQRRARPRKVLRRLGQYRHNPGVPGRLRLLHPATSAGWATAQGLPTRPSAPDRHARRAHRRPRTLLSQRLPAPGRRPSGGDGNLHGQVLRSQRGHPSRHRRGPPAWRERLQHGVPSRPLPARCHRDGNRRGDARDPSGFPGELRVPAAVFGLGRLRIGDLMSIKCVVWDLDDTLWRGTLLEGDDLVLAPGVGDVVRELDNRGILQSIASKNDHDAAWARVTAFGLDEFFLYPQICWADKSDSVRTIADHLGIGLDTVALVDDQAFERDEVRHVLPSVMTIDAADIGRMLDMLRMRPRFVTAESKIRRKMYVVDELRRRLENEFPGTRAEFLATLGMRVTIRAAGEPDLRRAEELTIRANQLNTTGRPYSYEELNALTMSPDHLLLVAGLEDRYGTSGTVGLALIDRGSSAWLIRLFITSCRVVTRGVGGIMMTHILESAKRSGVGLRAEFVHNDRNRMMYMTYKFHGFRKVAGHGDTALLEHDLENIRPYPRGVTVQVPASP